MKFVAFCDEENRLCYHHLENVTAANYQRNLLGK